MNQPQCKYVDTAFGDVSRRNNVMPVHAVPAALPVDRKNCYRTWHRFPEAYLDHRKRTGSVKGYRGTSYADFLPFDFDDAGGPEKSVLPTIDFLRMLEVSYDVDRLAGVALWFSGSKGFHVCLSSALFGGWVPSPDLAEHLRALALMMGKEFGIDPAIYDQNRLFRIQNTVHSTSGLYKAPLSVAEILSLSVPEIVKLAETPREVDLSDYAEAPQCPPCVSLWQSIARGQQGKKARVQLSGDVFNSDLREGEGRDVAAFRIACRLRDAGTSREMTLETLRFWNSKLQDPLTATDGEDVLEKKIQNAYGDSEQKEDRITPDKLKNWREMHASYTAYVETMKARKITLGFREVDKAIRGIAPGEVCTIIAKSGVGKTAFIQNAMLNIAQRQKEALGVFCSMEQPMAQCFERWAQMVGMVAGRDVESGWDDLSYRENLLQLGDQHLGDRLWTIDTPNLSLADLDLVITMAEAKTGRKVNVLGIDYLGMMDMSDLDKTMYAQVSKAVRSLKGLAKMREVAVLLLCQVQRATGDEGDSPLTIHSARESGAIEESADFLLGLYRPEMKMEDTKIVVQILKNRKGLTGAFTYGFERETLRITEQFDSFQEDPPEWVK